jgi:hypothetical protein
MRLRKPIRRAEEQGTRVARTGLNRFRHAFHQQAICVHDEEDLEPKPVPSQAIISVNGEDVERCRLQPELKPHKSAA